MSLVGSLEDLGLGDILQIVGLSGKSGVLMLRSGEGEGRIVFRDGLIRSAWLKGHPTSLSELLASRQIVTSDALDALADRARSNGVELESVVLEGGSIDAEGLERLRREQIEQTVLTLFRWNHGEFSFEMREPHGEEETPDTTVRSGGVNPQFLALEGARRADEGRPASSPPAREPAASVEPGEPPAGASPRAQACPPPAALPPVVVVDPDLGILEWAKESLSAAFPRIHIFQHSELGIARIRQYLARSELPIVVLSHDALPDPVSGAQTSTEIAARLQSLAASLRVVFLTGPRGPKGPAGATVLEKPGANQLAGRRGKTRRDELAELLRESLAPSRSDPD